MQDTKRIEKLKEEIQRLRDKINTLQDENTALKETLKDKENKITEIQGELDRRMDAWEQHLVDTSEAIEAAAEARLGYEQAMEAADKLRKEMDTALRAIRKATDRKAV